jgi:hypothetical protein
VSVLRPDHTDRKQLHNSYLQHYKTSSRHPDGSRFRKVTLARKSVPGLCSVFGLPIHFHSDATLVHTRQAAMDFLSKSKNEDQPLDVQIETPGVVTSRIHPADDGSGCDRRPGRTAKAVQLMS